MMLSSLYKEFKDNIDVISESFNQNYKSLKFASKEVLNNKEFILKCVKEEPCALDLASNKIKRLCKGKDPIYVLENAIKYDHLREKINNIGSPQKTIKL